MPYAPDNQYRRCRICGGVGESRKRHCERCAELIRGLSRNDRATADDLVEAPLRRAKMPELERRARLGLPLFD